MLNLLKVLASQLRHWILTANFLHQFFASLQSNLAIFLNGNGLLDGLADCQFAGTLANLGNVSAGETNGHLGEEGQIHVLGNRGLSQRSLEDLETAGLIRQWDVDELVQTAGTKNGRIDDVGTKNLKCSIGMNLFHWFWQTDW